MADLKLGVSIVNTHVKYVNLPHDSVNLRDFQDHNARYSSATQCPILFTFSCVVVLCNILGIAILATMLSHFDNKPIYVGIPLSMNWTLLFTAIIVLIMLATDGTQNSISGMVAQRLKPKSYFGVIFIAILSFSSSINTAMAFQFSERDNKDQVSFIFLFAGPIMMCMILIYPLIVKTPLHNVGITESITGENIQLSMFGDVSIITHTGDEQCANITHFVSVGLGVILSWIGLFVSFGFVNNGTIITIIVLIAISVIALVSFAIMGRNDSNPFSPKSDNEHHPRLDNKILFKNKLRILFEFVTLYLTMVSINIVSVDLIY